MVRSFSQGNKDKAQTPLLGKGWLNELDDIYDALESITVSIGGIGVVTNQEGIMRDINGVLVH